MATEVYFRLRYKARKSAKEEKFEKCKERFFVVFNWLTVLVISSLSFFTGINQTSVDTWNMTLYCDLKKFNKPASTFSKTWAVMFIIGLSVVISMMMSVKMFILRKVSNDIINIANYFIGMLLSWEVTFILQTMFSYPIPSFFNNEELKFHYCCPGCPAKKYTSKLENLDLQSRGSFPSFMMCALSYTTIFFYLFTCFLDNSKNFAAKLITLLVPGLITITYGWLLWIHNGNHVEDIIAGSFIGAFLAMYIMRDLFVRNNKFDKFANDFISVLMTREIELAQLNSAQNPSRDQRPRVNEYTLNLIPQNRNNATPTATREDRPPPYSSI